jgi:hypothetical protein
VCGVFLLLPVPVFIYYITRRRKSSSIYPMSPKAEKKFLKKVNKVIGGVLSEEERKVLLEAIHALKIKEVSELIDYVLHQ